MCKSVYWCLIQVSTHNAKRKLAERSQQPQEFLGKYDELKAKK